jgi:aspartate kinase
MKFGGTSVGTPESIKLVANAIEKQPDSKLVVLSANAGTTDDLVELIGYLPKELEKASEKLQEIRNRTATPLKVLKLFIAFLPYRP